MMWKISSLWSRTREGKVPLEQLLTPGTLACVWEQVIVGADDSCDADRLVKLWFCGQMLVVPKEVAQGCFNSQSRLCPDIYSLPTNYWWFQCPGTWIFTGLSEQVTTQIPQARNERASSCCSAACTSAWHNNEISSAIWYNGSKPAKAE